MHHFQSYYCYYIPKTRGERVSNSTVELFPVHVEMPVTSSEDQLTQITQDLITVLQKPHPKTPFLDQGDKTSNTIAQLKTIFQPPQKDDTRNTASPPRVSDTATSQAPRVLRSETTRRQSPRVLETNKMLENVIINQTQVKKKFGRHVFTGTVTKYDQKANLYFIEYTDGDCEEMTKKNIQTYQCTANTRTVNRLKQHLEKQQANQVLQGQTTRSLPPHYASQCHMG
eukprot:scaffold84797_cov47-Attheya_sp.AAC.2